MKTKDVWFFISLLGLLIFNWPFLEIFRKEVVTYLFVLWGIFVILAALAAVTDRDRKIGNAARKPDPADTEK